MSEYHKASAVVRKKHRDMSKTEAHLTPAEKEAKLRADGIRMRTLNTIMSWSRNVSLFQGICIAKAFYKWKFSHVTPAVNTIGLDPESLYRIGEQKSSYLALFAENERLRQELKEGRDTAVANERAMRHKAVKTLVLTIFRARLSSKIRYYFDLWMNKAHFIKISMNNAQRMMQLEIGLQRIDTERNYVKKTESMNSQLKFSLILTVYFFKWKSKTALMTLNEERKLFDHQRKLIFKELLRIREAVTQANKQEATLLSNSLSKGEDISNAITELKDQLQAVSMVCKQATKESSVGSGGSTASAGGSVGGSHGNGSGGGDRPKGRKSSFTSVTFSSVANANSGGVLKTK